VQLGFRILLLFLSLLSGSGLFPGALASSRAGDLVVMIESSRSLSLPILRIFLRRGAAASRRKKK
jgi:hypothetical protein